MPEVFLVVALLVSGMAALLYMAGERRLLNFVDYGSAPTVARINRYAAARLLIPVFVNLGCAYIAGRRPELSVPLIFLAPISILCAVVWVAAGISRLKA
jgi:hypothetical protein